MFACVSWNAASNAPSYNFILKKRIGCSNVTQPRPARSIPNLWEHGSVCGVNCDMEEHEYTVQACAGTTCSPWINLVVVRVSSNPALLTRLATYIPTDGLGSPIAEMDSSGQVTAPNARCAWCRTSMQAA